MGNERIHKTVLCRSYKINYEYKTAYVGSKDELQKGR